MAKKRAIWVSPSGDDWVVKREGQDRAIKRTEHKQDAIDKAIQVAKNDKAELIIQKRDGVIQSKDSYGNDPHPPKDMEH